MLRSAQRSDTAFVGEQRWTTGEFVPVTGTLIARDSLVMDASGIRWVMVWGR